MTSISHTNHYENNDSARANENLHGTLIAVLVSFVTTWLVLDLLSKCAGKRRISNLRERR